MSRDVAQAETEQADRRELVCTWLASLLWLVVSDRREASLHLVSQFVVAGGVPCLQGRVDRTQVEAGQHLAGQFVMAGGVLCLQERGGCSIW